MTIFQNVTLSSKLLEVLVAKVFHADRMNLSHNFTSQKYEANVLRLYPVGEMLNRVREATTELPKAILFELRDLGHKSLFEQVCGCVIAARTPDEISLPAALQLFKIATTAREVAELSEKKIYKMIRAVSFGKEKAKALKEIAQISIEQFDGELPANYSALIELPGLGPCAVDLVLSTSGNVPALEIDAHTHRVTNRWGYLHTESSEKSLQELGRKLPKKHWTELSELLVPFGKHICRGQRPKCSICPVAQFCERRGLSSEVKPSH